MSEETLFHEALARPTAERTAFLDAACADQPELRAAVESLLAAHEASGSLLDRPPVELVQTVDSAPAPVRPVATGEFTPAPDETPPPVVVTTAYRPQIEPGVVVAGRYVLQEKIGEGGMGEVWVAKQTEPVKRKVALKLIKAGMDSKAVLARFEQERQALALMDHPNIARVLDGGQTEDRRPFFVMELVNGLPLTKFCDEARLTPRERLEVFVPICQAVQHAHQKGIVHRDLKPANILVALIDGRPVPRVIDFGVAKATGGKLTDEPLSTQFGAVVGTLEYMSPEQAGFSGVDVDTRADIYSLGVILYELLTGLRPIDAKRLRQAAHSEMIRILQEEVPSKPSTRLSTNAALPSLAAARQTEPRKLTALLRGELDWMVMKCLEKTRERRYETANGLMRDIQRYLADEPVEARPPSAGYRLGKFLKRNKGPVVAAGLVLLALLAGIVGTTLAMVRATKAEGVARQQYEEAEAARARAAALAVAEAAQRQKAEKAEADTLADYRASTDDAIEQLIGSKPQLGAKERTYLENTLKRWQAFAARQGNDERSRAIRGEGHHRVAGLWQNLSRNEEARREYRAALDLRKQLVEQFPAVPEHQQNLASTHHGLANLLKVLGKREEAMAEYQAALDIRKKLVEQFPAAPVYEQELARTHHGLGTLLAELDRRQEARVEYQAALDIRKKLVKQFPGVPTYQRDLTPNHTSLGFLLYGLRRYEESQVEYKAAIAVGKKLVEQFPAVPDYQQSLAAAHIGYGLLFMGLGKWGESQAEFEAARDLQKKLVEQFPAMPTYKDDLAGAHNNLGIVLMRLGKREEALAEYRTALDIKKKLVEQYPAVPAYHYALSRSHLNMGELFRVLGKGKEARGEFRSAIDIQKKLVEQYPAMLEYQHNVGLFSLGYGCLIRDEGNLAESLKWFDQAIQTMKPLHEKEPRTVTFQLILRNSYLERAQIYDRLKKPAEAVKDWDRAIELSSPGRQPAFRANRANSQIQAGMVAEAVAEVEKLTKNAKWTQGQWYDFACVYSLASRKIAEKKTHYADRAMELLKKAVQMGFKDAAHMAKDTDLDPLRDRDDFKKLLAELEKKP